MLCVACAALAMSACKPPDQSATRQQPPPNTASQKVAWTQGRLDPQALRGRIDHLPEVLLLAEMQEDTRKLMEQQLRLFADSAADGSAAVQPDVRAHAFTLLDEETRQQLDERMATLRDKIPERQALDFTFFGVRHNRLLPSRALRDRYVNFIEHLQLEKLDEHLGMVAEAIKKDEQELSELAYQEKDNYWKYQAKADLAWLSEFATYLKEYKSVLDAVNRQLQAALEEEARQNAADKKEQATREQAWEQFKWEKGQQLEMLMARDLHAVTVPKPDGRFRVRGHGMLVFLMEVDGERLYIPEGHQGLPVKVIERQESVEEWAPAE